MKLAKSAGGQRSGCAESALQLMDLDDDSLEHVLLRALPEPEKSIGSYAPPFDEPMVKQPALLQVCTRFRDLLLARASGVRCRGDAADVGPLSLAARLRSLHLIGGTSLPWQTEACDSRDGLAIVPGALEHLAGLASLCVHNPAPGFEFHGVGALDLIELVICDCAIADEASIAGLARLSGLMFLRLDGVTLNTLPDSCLASLSSLQSLEDLILVGCHVRSADSLAFIAGLAAVAQLHLAFISVDERRPTIDSMDAILRHVSALRELAALSICFSTLSDRGTASLRAVTSLTRLELHHWLGATPRAMDDLASMHHLQTLVVSFELWEHEWWYEERWAEAYRIPALNQLGALTHLDLELVHSDDICCVADLTRLSELRLSFRHSFRYLPSLGAATGVAALASLRALTSLALDGAEVGAAFNAAVRALPGLRCLALTACRINEHAVEQLTALDSLVLRASPYGHPSLSAQLSTLTRLTALDCVSTGGGALPASSLAVLTTLRSLITLRLHVSGVTDEELRHVSTLTTLQELSVHSQSSSDVMTALGMSSVAALAQLTCLSLRPGGYVCGSALACLLPLRKLEALDVRAGGDMKSEFARFLATRDVGSDAQPPADSTVTAQPCDVKIGHFGMIRAWNLEQKCSYV